MSAEPSQPTADSAQLDPLVPEANSINKPWVPSDQSFDTPMTADRQQALVGGLNFLQLGWSAAHYPQFEHRTPRQLNQLAGLKRHVPRPKKKAVLSEPTSFLAMRTRHHRLGREEGDKLDWRNKDG